MRKFDNYNEAEKLRALSLAFAFAITAPAEKRKAKDIYELAAEFGKISGLKATDFLLIKHMTIEQIADMTNVNF